MMSTVNVQAIPTTKVNPELVDALEELLDRARRGTLIALAYATVDHELNAGTGWRTVQKGKWPLGAAVLMLQNRMGDALLNPGDTP